MKIVVNIGNTTTEIAPCADGDLIGQPERLKTETAFDRERSAWLLKRPDAPILTACVVPDAGKRLEEVRPGGSVRSVDVDAVRYPDFRGVEAATLGQDRVANAVAAVTLNGAPVIVLDCGTAITTEVVDAQGAFRGGVILPGRAAMLRALGDATAQLPELETNNEGPDSPLATTTREAILCGVEAAVLNGVQTILTRTRQQLRSPQCPVLVTGGDAPFFLSRLQHLPVQEAPAYLTLRGLAHLAGGGTP